MADAGLCRLAGSQTEPAVVFVLWMWSDDADKHAGLHVQETHSQVQLYKCLLWFGGRSCGSSTTHIFGDLWQYKQLYVQDWVLSGGVMHSAPSGYYTYYNSCLHGLIQYIFLRRPEPWGVGVKFANNISSTFTSAVW